MSFNKNIKRTFLSVAVLAFVIAACNKDDNTNPGETNEEELITTVRLTFTHTGTNAVVVFEGKDLDGVGGNPPLIDPIFLDAQTSYTLEAAFLDESKAQNVKDITEEVRREDEDHLVCYSSTGKIARIQTTDKDSAGAPLGLEATLTTGAAGEATLTITLKHKPNKSAANACLTGETDVELTFSVEVQ